MGRTKAAVLPEPVLAIPCGQGVEGLHASKSVFHAWDASSLRVQECNVKVMFSSAHQDVSASQGSRNGLRLDGSGLLVPATGASESRLP